MNLKLIASFGVSIFLLVSCTKDCPDEPAIKENIDLTKGLIAYFPFNANTNDESGNSNNGVLLNGSALTHDKNGRPASALNFTGAAQKMLVQNNGKIQFDTAMTISFNVMSRTNNRSSIVSITEHATGKGTSFVIGQALPANTNIIYSITNNDVGCDAIQTSGQVSYIDGGITLQPESWYNVVCTFRKGQMKLYFNGQQVSSRTSQNNLMRVCPNAQLLIGGWWAGDNASLNGKIDEVRLYNRELNSDEIKELAENFQ